MLDAIREVKLELMLEAMPKGMRAMLPEAIPENYAMPKVVDLVAIAARMPAISRREAVVSLSAFAVPLAAPRPAKAAGGDADVFAAVERLKDLRRAQKAAGERLAALERQLPEPPALVADHEEVSRAKNAIRLFRAAGIQVSDATLGPAYARAMEVCRVNEEWIRLRRAVLEGLDYKAADEAYNDTVAETDNAFHDLLDMRPRTLAGLRVLVAALTEAKLFDNDSDVDALLEMLLDSPALAGEA